MARILIVAVIAFVFAFGEGLVLAYPAVPGPAQPSIKEGADRPLLARRRRRRRRRRPRARRRRRTKRPRRAAPATPRRPAPTKPAAAAAAPPAADGALRRGARVEFDGRLVQGQTAKSGAIYLFARKRSELKSMVKERSSYRGEILRTVYPRFQVR